MSGHSSGNDGGASRCVVELLVGKLVGLRAGELRSIADVLSLGDELRSAVTKVSGPAIFCADYRRLQVMNGEVATAMLDAFRGFNSKLLRSAIILPANAATIRLQMERLLRDAGNPARRLCADSAEVKAWLSSYLSAPEKEKLGEFLAAP